jgi:hypothetical protein
MLCLYGIKIQAANAKLLHQNMVNTMQNAHFGMQNAHFGADKIGEPQSKEKGKVVQNVPKYANLDRAKRPQKHNTAAKCMV